MKTVGQYLLVLGLCGLHVSARADIVPLRELEKRALTATSFEESHAARGRGAEAEIRKAAAAYYPQVALRAETSLQPGRQLVRVCQPNEPKCSAGDDKSNEYLVSGARALGQDNAFAVQPINRAEITANAPIYDFGRTKAAVQAGRFSYEAIRAERDIDAEALVRTVRVAYLQWLSNHELAKVTEGSARDAEDRYARVSALVEQGVRPKVELGPVQSDALLTKLELTRAQGDLASALRTLESVVGAPLPSGAEPDASLLDDAGGVAPFSAVADALERALDRQRAAAHALELSYKRSRRPQFGVSFMAGARNQKDKFFPLYGAALSFVAPLYDGGIAKAAAQGARAQADAADAQLKQHVRDQERAHGDALHDAEKARSVRSIAEELRGLALRRLEDAQAGYELGVNGIEKIAEARALLRRAETELLMSKVSETEARLRVAPVDLDVR